MLDKPVFLTAEGKEKLEAELEHLRTVRRREVAQRIRAAKEGGDVTDNADYEDAKMEQGFVEGRIRTIEAMLHNAALIEPESTGSRNGVQLGSRVTLLDLDGGDGEETFLIVGSAEASPGDGRISNESPLGRAVIGKHLGDEILVAAPSGALRFRVKAID